MPKPFVPSFVFLITLLLPVSIFAAETPKLPGKTDVRLIIDISGSMKQNDPHNLRRPAVRMVSRLLPDGSEAGVWTFGRQVNMLVPHGRVDDAWRRKAVTSSQKINSVGLYTNIGKALEVASDDFYRARQFDRTHFILLTDGMVDIPGGQRADDAERKRILTGVLKRIKAHGAHIDTIALSPQADRGLLKRLAVATGGTFTVATTAGELSRAFLEAFDRASPSEQVPISHNSFRVDSSIREFTALVFHNAASKPMHLIAPDGTSFGANSSSQKVRWLHEKAYDMVTVQRPQAGSWHIDAQLKPHSRVTVVSNLRMAVSQLPANFYPGDPLDLGVAFYDQQSQITNKDFLGLIKVTATVSDQSGRSGTKTLSEPGHAPEGGVYNAPIKHLSRPGRYQVKVRADGKTFQREQTQTITLRAPVDVEIHGQGTGKQSRYLVTVIPQDPKLDPQDTTVALRYQSPGGRAAIQDLKFNRQRGVWQETLTATKGPGVYKAELRVIDGVAGSKGGRVIFAPDAFRAHFPRPAEANAGYVDLPATSRPAASKPPATTSAVTSSPVNMPAVTETPPPAKAPLSPAKTSEPAKAPVKPSERGNNDRLLSMIGGGVGGVVLLAGAFWFWRRRRGKTEEQQQARDESATETVEQPDSADTGEEQGASVEQPLEQEPEPALEPMDEDEPESEATEADGADESSDPEGDQAIADLKEALAEASPDTEADEAIPVMEESVPEPGEAPADGDVEEAGAAADDLDPEALADQILEENNQGMEDDDYGLEDFDIGDVDDLQQEAPLDGGKPPEDTWNPDDNDGNERKS